MPDLQRLTTEYIGREDRIRLAGEVTDGPAVTLWLTRRLLDRLIPHLILWLEQQHADLPRPDIMREFAQQQAHGQLVPQAPVAATAGQLVQEVSLTPSREQVHLTFKPAPGEAASIAFVPTALRQWLGILHLAYTTAEWPLTVWPVWIRESSQTPDRHVAVWH